MQTKVASRFGSAFLQTPDEWSTRNRYLADAMCDLAAPYIAPKATRGLDVGCQQGALTDLYAAGTGLRFDGIDPVVEEQSQTPAGHALCHGTAESIPFPDQSFSVVVFANVFEHVVPANRTAALVEIKRVLTPDGIVVGQIPNPWFPIESHSRLPFMGWLPEKAQERYWRLSPTPWAKEPGSKAGIFYSANRSHLRSAATAAGLQVSTLSPFNYPLGVIPKSLRPIVRALQRPMRALPWAWQFVLTTREGRELT
jgi:SAM-dependent methyltransferase